MTSAWGEVADRVWVRRHESLDQTIGVVGGSAGLLVIDAFAAEPTRWNAPPSSSSE